MPDFKKNLAEWRRQMTAGGIKDPVLLDELESHLRDDLQQQMKSGVPLEQAFEIAVEKIGSPRIIRKEFRKTAVASILEKLMVAAAFLFLAFGIFLSGATVVLCFAALVDRLIASTVIGLILLVGCGWPRMVPYLPVIERRARRYAIEVACLLAGYGIAAFFVEILLPLFESGQEWGGLPAIGFLGLLPVAIGIGVACGLERAARSQRIQRTA